MKKNWSFTSESTLLSQVTFCVVDLETTGSSSAFGAITEIGAVKYRGGEEVSRFGTLINPGQPIPANIVMLTGISSSMVADAPRIEDVLDIFLDFVQGTVLVAHNARFDVGFLNAALERHGYDPLSNAIVDTVTLARRLVRSEVPNCKLSTLAAHFNFPHQPIHRAMDDVLATGDLLHYLIERAAAFGVYDIDDLVALPSLGAHPESQKLKMTEDLPRGPGVYLFLDLAGEVLYVGKATNVRTRVRSYFSTSETRKKVGSLLKLVHSIQCIETPDAVTAEVFELRIIRRLRPRYNYAGTRSEKYCYVRLTTDEEWPRLVVSKVPSAKGIMLGPIRTRGMARDVVDAIESVLPLSRCTIRMGRNYVAPEDASVCSAARLGLAQCPCSGSGDASTYAIVVDTVARNMRGESDEVVSLLTARMMEHSNNQRFEEAARSRNRIDSLNTALFRQRQADALRQQGDLELSVGHISYQISAGILQSTTINGLKITPESVELPTIKQDLRALLQVPIGEAHVKVLDEVMCVARLVESLG
ncbi:MAG: DEDD exonuclease domain-containing protein [Ilumatobacteraceae bacterium]|nr:DEDD exonuclease domain-containing protein [Ilumatobacteraceae bacterium]